MRHPFRLAVAVVAAGAVAGWTMPLTHAHADPGGISDVTALVGLANITGDAGTGACIGTDPQDTLQPAGVEKHAAVDLTGGCGTFFFSSSVCAGFSADDGAGTCQITATGNFTNVRCGTGQATGTSTVNVGKDAGATTTFTINFTAGIGLLSGTTNGSPPDSPEPTTGVVLLGPSGVPADGPPDCADGFSIVAVAVAQS